VLSGDGADELFLGYKWHIKHKNFDSNNYVFSESSLNSFNERINSICAFPLKQRKMLWDSSNMINDDIVAKDIYKNLADPMDCVALFDLTSHLPGQILTKVDRASMMHGLEVRSPFLDTALIEFVFNLPYKYKVSNGEQKYILKDILTEYMPYNFVYRRKQGFGAPIEQWLLNPVMKKYLYKKLNSNASIKLIFSEKNIDKYLYDFYINSHKHERAAQRLWTLLCLESFMKQLNFNI
jgi:asparagine synthase (glutamine-hydrolysing)